MNGEVKFVFIFCSLNIKHSSILVIWWVTDTSRSRQKSVDAIQTRSGTDTARMEGTNGGPSRIMTGTGNECADFDQSRNLLRDHISDHDFTMVSIQFYSVNHTVLYNTAALHSTSNVSGWSNGACGSSRAFELVVFSWMLHLVCLVNSIIMIAQNDKIRKLAFEVFHIECKIIVQFAPPSSFSGHTREEKTLL